MKQNGNIRDSFKTRHEKNEDDEKNNKLKGREHLKDKLETEKLT